MRPDPRTADLGHTRLDLDRPARIGMPEAVFAAGKSVEQCVDIVTHLLDATDEPIVVTRTDPSQRDALQALLVGRGGTVGTVWSDTLTWQHRSMRPIDPVAVVCGGTSDLAVVDECIGTLTAYGIPTRRIVDVGVAGVHRLLTTLDEFEDASAIIAVAGMEAALPTVLAGLVAQPIIAVPTSVGYGSTFGGITALLSMMASCAPGVCVVGIDNGFGAACAAGRIVASLQGRAR